MGFEVVIGSKFEAIALQDEDVGHVVVAGGNAPFHIVLQANGNGFAVQHE